MVGGVIHLSCTAYYDALGSGAANPGCWKHVFPVVTCGPTREQSLAILENGAVIPMWKRSAVRDPIQRWLEINYCSAGSRNESG
jgi:hypothetical protein